MAGRSPESDFAAAFSGDLRSFYAICDADDEILPEMEEEMVEKVMHELLKEINGNESVPRPGSGSGPFPPPAGFVVGESCGPAFSGSGSTVMAGIEMSGGGAAAADFKLGGGVGVLVGPIRGVLSGFGALGFPAGVCGGDGPCAAAVEGKGKGKKQCNMQGGDNEEEMRMDGYDGEDFYCDDDDEWLKMFLNYAPPELDEWL